MRELGEMALTTRMLHKCDTLFFCDFGAKKRQRKKIIRFFIDLRKRGLIKVSVLAFFGFLCLL